MINQYDMFNSENGTALELQNIVYCREKFNNYIFKKINDKECLVGVGSPLKENVNINKSTLLYDILKMCQKCDFYITYDESNYIFTDEDKEKIIKFCRKYGFPLLNNFSEYYGESPAYNSEYIYQELREFTFAMAARQYLINNKDGFKWTKCYTNTESASIKIIDYVSSAKFKIVPHFFSTFKGFFKYDIYADSIFDIVKINFCMLLNSDNFNIGQCGICGRLFKKDHGNHKYCDMCNLNGRAADKNYKNNLKNDPVQSLCKKQMDRYRSMLGTKNEQYKIIRDKIINLRKQALDEKWSIEKVEVSLNTLLKKV